MRDDEAKLCWKLADRSHRLDWWNIKREHSRFEWLCQIAREVVEPSGDSRADMRAAHNTARSLLSQAATPPTDTQVNELYDELQFYLNSNQPPDILVTPAQMAAMNS